MKYNTLCISSGGVKGFYLLGALKYLFDKNILNLKNINTFVGTSIGSIIILFLSIGHSVDSLINIFYSIDFSKLDIEINFDNVFENFGLDNATKIITIIQTLLYDKINLYDISFKNLFEITKKEIKIIAVNYSKQKEVMFSYETTPDMSVILAIRMSISIPFIFNPVNYRGDLYIDGAFLNHLGIEYCNLNNSIALCFNTDFETLNHDVDNFFDFIVGIMSIVYKKVLKKNLNHKNIIKLDVIDNTLVGSELNPSYLTKKQKLDNLKQGYKLCKKGCYNKVDLYSIIFVNKIISKSIKKAKIIKNRNLIYS
tara:strand:+ start:1796 stop:2728 length:933 start_codon:yes stop_codon:yes gene_type:complete